MIAHVYFPVQMYKYYFEGSAFEFGAFELLKSSYFKFLSTGVKNCVQMPYPSAGFDGQFVYKRQDQRL